MKRKPRQRSEVPIAVAWYSVWDWQRLKRVAADAESLYTTYREWANQVEQTIATLREAGANVQKLEVDVEELQPWCRSRSLDNPATNRAAFVAEKSLERGMRL